MSTGQEKTGRRLARNVNVDGVWYRAGDEVPDDVAAQITNPGVWVSAPTPGTPDPAAGLGAGTTGGRRLRTRVHVDDAWYGPDDHIPDRIAAQVTNPKVWTDQKPPGGAGSGSDDAGAAADPDPSGAGGGGSGGVDPAPPTPHPAPPAPPTPGPGVGDAGRRPGKPKT